jgi:hypothetical protein
MDGVPSRSLVYRSKITPDQARALSMRGQASVEIVDGVVDEYLAAARKAMDADAAAEFEQCLREMFDQMARIVITPQWVRYNDFGAGRMPRFLEELAERNQS